ncbi:MAG: sugar phosphate isomerase/epimerase family protein [Pirellulales bacterium]
MTTPHMPGASTAPPRLAAFPKAYMQALCRDGSMRLADWIDLAATLDVDGVEWYAGFLEMADEARWPGFRAAVEAHGMTIPMFCCSPDFTHPDPVFRRRQIDQQLRWIDTAHALGARFCRVLSGQRRPELSEEQGLDLAAERIRACLPHARSRGVTLILENHYKDDFWDYPEFAQKLGAFCGLVDRLPDEGFGVNYDPSNAILAGDDPLELLRRVSHRVVTMHASDRFLVEGTLDDLRREEGGSQGYARRLRHGEVGKGLNDYDAIFTELRARDFSGWISIEDGVDGFEQLARSVAFLRRKMAEYWPVQGR